MVLSGNTKVKLEFYTRPIFQTWWPLTSRLLSSPYVYSKRMSQFCHILSSEWLKNFLCVEIINFHLQFTLTHFPKSFNLDHLFSFIMFSFTREQPISFFSYQPIPIMSLFLCLSDRCHKDVTCISDFSMWYHTSEFTK